MFDAGHAGRTRVLREVRARGVLRARPLKRSAGTLELSESGHRVLFATATGWVTQLTDTNAGRLPQRAPLWHNGLTILADVV